MPPSLALAAAPRGARNRPRTGGRSVGRRACPALPARGLGESPPTWLLTWTRSMVAASCPSTSQDSAGAGGVCPVTGAGTEPCPLARPASCPPTRTRTHRHTHAGVGRPSPDPCAALHLTRGVGSDPTLEVRQPRPHSSSLSEPHTEPRPPGAVSSSKTWVGARGGRRCPGELRAWPALGAGRRARGPVRCSGWFAARAASALQGRAVLGFAGRVAQC